MEGSVNIINWFEIATGDIARAKKFYENVFEIEMQEAEMMEMKMAFFIDTEGNNIGLHSMA